MISVPGLVKSFGEHSVLQGIDLELGNGECLALVGPNGAGKTTLFRILATLSTPTMGSVCIAGIDLADGATAIRRSIGFLSHQPLVYDGLSSEENRGFYGRMYDVANLNERIPLLLRQVGLERFRHDTVGTSSRGMKQRLAIARAFLHNPPVLLLDQPYTGLDQQGARMLDTVLRDVGLGSRTVLLTTHDLGRGLSISQRVALLVNGKIVYQMGKRDWDLDRLRQEYEERTTGESLVR